MKYTLRTWHAATRDSEPQVQTNLDALQAYAAVQAAFRNMQIRHGKGVRKIELELPKEAKQ